MNRYRSYKLINIFIFIFFYYCLNFILTIFIHIKTLCIYCIADNQRHHKWFSFSTTHGATTSYFQFRRCKPYVLQGGEDV